MDLQNILFDVPAVIKSRETYEFLGFNADTAQVLWTRYTSASDDDPTDFFYYINYHLSETSDEPGSSPQEWEEFMINKGVQQWLRQAILMDEFADLRYTATCIR